MELGKNRNNFLRDNESNNNIKLNKYYTENSENFSTTTSIEIKSQHWGGNGQLSMEDIAVEYFSN